MAAYVYEIACRAGDEQEAAFRWLGQLLPHLTFPACEIDVYKAISAAGPAPTPHEEASFPTLIVHVGFEDPASAQTCLGEARLRQSLAAGQDQFALTGELMRTHAFETAGRAMHPLIAPFSYVVRYMLPAPNVEAFQAYYMKMHPPILAEFVGIRNVFCYVPVEMKSSPLRGAGYLIGNEVVFDDVADFEKAMASPVRDRSKADAATFSPYSGLNAHYPMQRTRISRRTHLENSKRAEIAPFR